MVFAATIAPSLYSISLILLMFKLPPKEQILENKWLKWIGPKIHHPEFWVWSRRNVATGVALGLFFGFMIPLGQIPLAVACGVMLRANLPICAASTFVTNPFTFPPIYYAAYEVGSYVLRSEGAYLTPTQAAGWLEWALGVGKPTFLGLAIFAITASSLSYLLIRTVWGFKTRLKWINRSKKRLAKTKKV